MSPKIDLIARVDAARKAKGTSPFIGIATPRGTLMLRRDVLKKSLAGLPNFVIAPATIGVVAWT